MRQASVRKSLASMVASFFPPFGSTLNALGAEYEPFVALSNPVSRMQRMFYKFCEVTKAFVVWRRAWYVDHDSRMTSLARFQPHIICWPIFHRLCVGDYWDETVNYFSRRARRICGKSTLALPTKEAPRKRVMKKEQIQVKTQAATEACIRKRKDTNHPPCPVCKQNLHVSLWSRARRQYKCTNLKKHPKARFSTNDK